MALHRLARVVIGVPDVAGTGEYYRDFGLEPLGGDGAAGLRFGTRDGGEQLRLVPSAQRRLVEIVIGADDADDLGRIAASSARLGVPIRRGADCLTLIEPITGVRAVVRVEPRVVQPVRGTAVAPSAAGDRM